MNIEIEREVDGRWIAEIAELPVVMEYGTTRSEAVAKTEAISIRVLSEGGAI